MHFDPGEVKDGAHIKATIDFETEKILAIIIGGDLSKKFNIPFDTLYKADTSLGVGSNTYTGDFAGRGLESSEVGFLDTVLVSERSIALDFKADSSGLDQIRILTASVPEPATMLLLGAGLIGLAAVGRKKFFK